MQSDSNNDHKRQPLPLPPRVEAELNPGTAKKRRTIEDVGDLFFSTFSQIQQQSQKNSTPAPAQTSKPTITAVASGPTTPSYTLPQCPRPQAYQSFPTAANGYSSYQFNNYISQNTYPLIANYYSYNIVSGDPARTDMSRPMYPYHPQSGPTASVPAARPATNFAVPSFMPTSVAAKKSSWDKPPDRLTSPTIVKALSYLASANKTEKVDVLEDKSLPDSVRKFIIRGYAKCFTPQERDYMKMLLRQMVDRARINGQLESKKWDEMELPKLPREAARAVSAAPVVPRPALDLSQKFGLSAGSNGVTTSTTIIGPVLTQLLQSEQSPPAALAATNGPKAKSSLGNDNSVTAEEAQKRSERKNRFAVMLEGEQKPVTESARNFEDEMLDLGIKGTCTKLEKQYFRLSTAPDPSTVRPEEVLKKALRMVKTKWKSKETEYAYVCDQLRSIRQDMMLQRIKNDFAVEVYETHARIALECRDISHFNQCQTQLDELYNCGIKGHTEEFLGYRILYAGLHGMQIELMQILKKLTLKDKQAVCVQHALRVVRALSDNNYLTLFKLYKQAPNMGTTKRGYLIDLFIERLRVFALQALSVTQQDRRKSIGSVMGVELKLVADQLAFESVDKCAQFVQTAGGRVDLKTMRLECKESIQGLRSSPMLSKKIIQLIDTTVCQVLYIYIYFLR